MRCSIWHRQRGKLLDCCYKKVSNPNAHGDNHLKAMQNLFWSLTYSDLIDGFFVRKIPKSVDNQYLVNLIK